MQTNKETIQEFFKMKHGKYYDFEYVENTCFEVAIKAILENAKNDFDVYTLLEDIFVLENKLCDSEKRIKELESRICWITKEFEIKLKAKELEYARKSK